jgi:hypothetical protein
MRLAILIIHRIRHACATGAAERQDPVFLIGPRNKKTGKKRSTIKILYPPVQIAS